MIIETQDVSGAGDIDAGSGPFAFQLYAKDFYAAYKKHRPGAAPFSPACLFLLSRSIELAAKAMHLKSGKDPKKLQDDLGHDLTKACDAAVLATYNVSVTPVESAELSKANDYYERKGFEYYFFKLPGLPAGASGPEKALKGWPNRPDESVLAGLLDKLLKPTF